MPKTQAAGVRQPARPIIQELREKGIDADRAHDRGARGCGQASGSITRRCRRTLQRRLGLARRLEVLLFQATSNTSLQCRQRKRRQAFGERHALAAVGATPRTRSPRETGPDSWDVHDGPAVRRRR